MAGDERELDVVVKLENQTKAGFAELIAQMAALTVTNAAAGAAAAVANLSFTAFGATITGPLIVGVGLAVVALWPLIFALGAIIANVIALTTLFTVAAGAAGVLAFAIFQLGAANAGGLSPATEMVKAHHALDTAIKEHTEALKELKQAQAGVDIYNLGAGGKAETIRLAQSYVTATTRNLQDAQHDIREPASGLGGPIDKLGSSMDDLRHHFETLSRPFADHIAMWVSQFLPAIQNAGDALSKWFGDRLPAFLNFATPLVHDLADMFKGIGTAIGNVVDYVLAHPKTFQDFFKDVTSAIPTVLTNIFNALVNIHTWFDANWPSIQKQMGDFGAAWKTVSGTIDFIRGNFPALATAATGAAVLIAAAGYTAAGPWAPLLVTLTGIVAALTFIQNSKPTEGPGITPGSWVPSNAPMGRGGARPQIWEPRPAWQGMGHLG